MPIARTADVLSRVRDAVRVEAEAAANHNAFVSREEQAAMQPGLLRDSADEMRAAGQRRVTVDALVETTMAKINGVLGQVNQPTGPGAASVSMQEVRAAAALSPEGGVRLARAYELLTGRRVDVPGHVAPPPPATVDFEGIALTQPQADLIVAYVNTASRQALDRDAHLDTRAADSIISNRPVADIAALSALPWIGAQARDILVNHLRAQPGWPATAAVPALAPASLAPITGAATTSPGIGLTVLTGGALRIQGGGLPGSTFSVDVGGQTIHATLPDEHMSGHTTNVALACDVVEALRRAAAGAGYDVRVVAHGGNASTVELWPAGQAPAPPSPPTYLFAQLQDANGTRKDGFEVRGPLRFMWTNMNPGDRAVVQVDGKRYEVIHRANVSSIDELKRQLEADGRTVELRDYGGGGSLRITG